MALFLHSSVSVGSGGGERGRGGEGKLGVRRSGVRSEHSGFGILTSQSTSVAQANEKRWKKSGILNSIN
jgi:hypothetical protein